MNQFSNNSALNKNIRANQLDIPITINGNGTLASITASVDDEFAGSCEIFVATTTGAAQDGKLAGTAGAVGSVLDPSANDVNGKAFPTLLSSDTGPVSIGLIVADGSLSKPPNTIPLQNSDPSNPAYGTQTVDGRVSKVYAADLVISEGGNMASVVGVAARAQILGGGATPNGNIKVVITLPKFVLSAITPTAVAVAFNTANTFKGVIRIRYN